GFRDDIDPAQCRFEDSIPGEKAIVPLTEGDGRGRQGVSPATRIEFTNLDKVFWPEDGYTKGDLINYYDKISPYLIPHLLDRPLVFERFTDGIYGFSFYQKDAPDHTLGCIRTEEIWSVDFERSIRYFICTYRAQ